MTCQSREAVCHELERLQPIRNDGVAAKTHNKMADFLLTF